MRFGRSHYKKDRVFNASKRCSKGEKSSDKSFEGADEVELGSKPLILGFINSNFQ